MPNASNTSGVTARYPVSWDLGAMRVGRPGPPARAEGRQGRPAIRRGGTFCVTRFDYDGRGPRPGTGYTGEEGLRSRSNEAAEGLFTASRDAEITPAGLRARGDTLASKPRSRSTVMN